MAIQRGCLGPISGKVGDRVYATVNGVTHVRSLPRKTTKPATEKQLIQRAKFELVYRFLHSAEGIINSSYKLINRKKTGRGVTFRQILAEAIRGEYPDLEIDYSKVKLIRGQLSSPHGTCVQAEKPDRLNFSWSSFPQMHIDPTDELIVLFYCNSLKKFCCNQDLGIRRSDKCCTIRVPEMFAGRECCVWLAYRSALQNAFSDSVYLGKVFTI